jgi:hypothetical protein
MTMKRIARLTAGFLLLVLLGLAQAQPLAAANLLQTSGKLTLLRVHALGSKYGPPQDQIDVEVVVKLANQADKAFGFQLRDDAQGPVRRAMLDIFRDAFRQDWTVTIDYWIDPGKMNGIIHRVWVTR